MEFNIEDYSIDDFTLSEEEFLARQKENDGEEEVEDSKAEEANIGAQYSIDDFTMSEEEFYNNSSVDKETEEEIEPMADMETTEAETPKEDNKFDLINKKYKSSIEAIDNAIINLDSLNVDDSTKDLLLKKYEQAKITAEEDKINKIREENKYQQDLFKNKSSKVPSVGERALAGAVGSIGGISKNVLAPMAELVGLDNVASFYRDMGDISQDDAKRVEDEFKKQYGEDTWNVAQTFGEAVPDLVVSYINSARKIPQAIGEASVTYAKTGDVKQAAVVGVSTLAGSAIIDKVFSLGAKQVATKFGKDIEKLPIDERRNVEAGLKALDESNIDSLDEQARREIINKLDLTKSTEEIGAKVRAELNSLKDKADKAQKQEYKIADEIAKQTEKAKISSDFIKELKSQSKNTDKENTAIRQVKLILGLNKKKGKKGSGDVSDLEKLFEGGDLSKSKSKANEKGYNAFELEGKLITLKQLQRSPKAESGKHIYTKAIEKLQSLQDDVGEGIYDKARQMNKEYKAKFQGSIPDEGVVAGSKIAKVIDEKTKRNLGKKILTKSVDSETSKDLVNINLSQASRNDLAKDILSDGLDKDILDTRSNVNKIVSNWNNADQGALKTLLGKTQFDKMNQDMKALELIQNTMDLADDQLGKNIINFASNAMLAKISPVYAAKGVIYEGRQIATKIAFKKQREAIQKRIKDIPDRTTRNRISKAFNNAMMSIAGSKLFEAFEEEED